MATSKYYKKYDVTDFIRDEVEKMIAIATVARGKDWAIEMGRQKIRSFIEHEIELRPIPSSVSKPPSRAVTTLIVYNGRSQEVNFPNYIETPYEAGVDKTIEFVVGLPLRAHKNTEVVVHQSSKTNQSARAGVGAGVAVGAITGSLIPIFGTLIGAGIGGLVGIAAGTSVGVVSAVTKLTLTAEEIFKVNEGIAEYRVEDDFVYLTLEHVLKAPVEEATV